jgi:hypothetical protein
MCQRDEMPTWARGQSPTHRGGPDPNPERVSHNDDIPSAETILPEFQHLEIGQVIGEEGLAVRKLEPGWHLVLAFHCP